MARRWRGHRGDGFDRMLTHPGAFALMCAGALDAMVMVDSEGRITAINQSAERILGGPAGGLLGEPWRRCVPAAPAEVKQPARRTGVPPRGPEPGGRCMARRWDGTVVALDVVRHQLASDPEADSLLTLRVLGDAQPLGTLEFPAREVASAVLASIGDGVITTDLAGRVTYLNTVAERMSGWTAEDARGLSLETVLPLIAESTRKPIENTALRCLEEGRSVDLEPGVLLLRRDGAEIPIGDSAAPVRDQFGTVLGAVLVIQDESEDRRVGHQLTFEATHDELTGLLNRREFDRRLTRVIAGLGTGDSEQALLVLDLDGFKLVNDSCGHAAGDELLRDLGPLMGRHLRKRDTLARLGGDEFGILLENCPLIEAALIAECLRVAIAEHRLPWGGEEFSIGASIGLIPITVDPGEVAAVQRLGDAACYEAKRLGGNQVHLERRRHARALGPEDTERRNGHATRGLQTGHARLIAELLHHPLAPSGALPRAGGRARSRKGARASRDGTLAFPLARNHDAPTTPAQEPSHE